MPLTISGSLVSERSHGRSSQVSGLPKIAAHVVTAARGSFSGGRAEQLGEARVGEIIGQAMAAQLGEVGGGEIARTPAGHPGVERHDDRLEAGLLGPPDQARRELAIGRGVELEESGRRLELGGDGFERIDRQGRSDHRHAGQRGGARGREIAVAVLGAEPDHADRGS